MDLAHRIYADVLVLAPVGRIDYSNAAELERQVTASLESGDGARAGMVFDFSGVTYTSSVGLRVLLVASKALRQRNARVAVAALQPLVAEIFAISRFESVVEIFPTVRDALRAISPAALSAYDSSGPRL